MESFGYLHLVKAVLVYDCHFLCTQDPHIGPFPMTALYLADMPHDEQAVVEVEVKSQSLPLRMAREMDLESSNLVVDSPVVGSLLGDNLAADMGSVMAAAKGEGFEDTLSHRGM